jgi:hypothetical protein
MICDRYIYYNGKTWCSIFSPIIDKPGISIINQHPEVNKKVNAFNFHISELLEYLPTKVNEVFPNLEVYYALDTAVREVSYENFEGMFKLKTLAIYGSALTTINEGVFKDLINLELLDLGEMMTID